MNLTRPVYWHSGQYLDPQHFQQTDSFHAGNAARYTVNYIPWYWGVDVCRVNIKRLEEEILELSALALRFQDGAYTRCRTLQDQGNAVVFPRVLSQAWSDRSKPFTVYAGLCPETPSYNVAGILGSSQEEPSGAGRFLASETEELQADRYLIPQQTGHTTEAPVRTLYYWVRLFWENELQKWNGHHIFPLLRLTQHDTGILVDPGFIPPLLSLHTWPLLRDRLQTLCSDLARMNERLRSAAASSLFDTFVSPAFLLLQASECCIMDIDSLTSRQPTPPWTIFETLRHALAAMLPCLPHQHIRAHAIPTYAHHDAQTSFTKIFACFDSIIHAILPKILGVCTFTPEEDWFVTTVPEKCRTPDAKPVLVLHSAHSPSELIKAGKIMLSAATHMRDALQYALQTTPLKVCEAPPPGLRQREDVYYLEPDIHTKYWEDILQEGRAAVAFFPEPPVSAEEGASRIRFAFLATD